MRFEDQRKAMVKHHLLARGVASEKVIEAFLKVPRELFVPRQIRHLSYNDSPLGIGEGQTISQPYIVALMMDLIDIQSSDKILEIGTGSGYQTALLAEIAKEVYTVERIPVLLSRSRNLLNEMGYENIFYKVGDGTKGWENGIPSCHEFNKIIVAAAAPDIPESLIDQLAMDGKMVIPTGNRAFQNLIVINKTSEGTIHTNHGGCAFVPLIGEEGWYES